MTETTVPSLDTSSSVSTGKSILTDLGFETISPGISIYNPPATQPLEATVPNGTANVPHTGSSASSNTVPDLIILCSWAFAQPRHISKYISGHQSLYPRTRILLIQNIIANLLWQPDAWQMSYFEPGARVIQEYVNSLYTSTPARDPKVLLHVFSNGGSHAAVQLAQACREFYGGLKLPVSAIVLDSCPGQPRFSETINALVLGIPSKNVALRALGAVGAAVSVGTTGVLDILGISELAAWKLWKTLNDPYGSFLLRRGPGEDSLIPRTYIYGPDDAIILEKDVEEHARIARERAIAHGIEREAAESKITLERFVGSAHVNHVKIERRRYWDVVEKTWADSC